jgi:hypothetical protein
MSSDNIYYLYYESSIYEDILNYINNLEKLEDTLLIYEKVIKNIEILKDNIDNKIIQINVSKR